MPDLVPDEPVAFDDALAAVRRAVIEPEELPRRVAAAAVTACYGADSPARLALAAWDTEPATGQGARQVAGLVAAVLTGSAGPADVAPVRIRYGVEGVVAAVSLSALAVAEDLHRPPAPPGAPVLEGTDVRLGDELVGLSLQLSRSFGQIPKRWRRLAAQRSVVGRWWMLHESALHPGELHGEERWLSMAVLADALGDESLRGLYVRFLVGQGWSDTEVRAAMAGSLVRVRRGLVRLLPAAAALAAGRLDLPRLRLAAADLPERAAAEMVGLIRLARALVCMRVLADAGGD